jgi:hypothetical protein
MKLTFFNKTARDISKMQGDPDNQYHMDVILAAVGLTAIGEGDDARYKSHTYKSGTTVWADITHGVVGREGALQMAKNAEQILADFKEWSGGYLPGEAEDDIDKYVEFGRSTSFDAVYTEKVLRASAESTQEASSALRTEVIPTTQYVYVVGCATFNLTESNAVDGESTSEFATPKLIGVFSTEQVAVRAGKEELEWQVGEDHDQELDWPRHLTWHDTGWDREGHREVRRIHLLRHKSEFENGLQFQMWERYDDDHGLEGAVVLYRMPIQNESPARTRRIGVQPSVQAILWETQTVEGIEPRTLELYVVAEGEDLSEVEAQVREWNKDRGYPVE